MLVTDDLPELGSDLVAALAGLEVDDFSHVGVGCCLTGGSLKTGCCHAGWLDLVTARLAAQLSAASCHTLTLAHCHTSHLPTNTLTMVNTTSSASLVVKFVLIWWDGTL